MKKIPYTLRRRKIFKEKNHPILKEKNIPYSLRRGISFSIPNVNTQKYGISSLNFRGSVLWNSLPIKFKKCKFLQELKLLWKQSETYCALAQRVKLKEFSLPVVLFWNLNFYVLFHSMYVCKYFQFVTWFLLVNTRIVPT